MCQSRRKVRGVILYIKCYIARKWRVCSQNPKGLERFFRPTALENVRVDWLHFTFTALLDEKVVASKVGGER
jgi:hypothetical protein